MSPEAENLSAILARIEAARKQALAPAASTTLVAVTKTHGPERIRPMLEAGHRVFGENRVQEALGKWPALKAEFPDIELHLIGPLQTNKVKEACGLFDVIQTLDREKLADAIAAERDKTGRSPRLLIQVNTGEEEQKAGASVEDVGVDGDRAQPHDSSACVVASARISWCACSGAAGWARCGRRSRRARRGSSGGSR